MKLVAIYVESYKSLKDLTFNFDHRFDVSYKDDYLKITRLNMDNYHYYGSGSSINLVLGTNGVGKSTLMEIIIDAFLDKPFHGFHLWYDGLCFYLVDNMKLVVGISTDEYVERCSFLKELNLKYSVGLLKLSNVIDICNYAQSEFLNRNRDGYLDFSNNKIIRKSKRKIISDDIVNEIDYIKDIYVERSGGNVPIFKVHIETYNLNRLYRNLRSSMKYIILKYVISRTGNFEVEQWLGLRGFIQEYDYKRSLIRGDVSSIANLKNNESSDLDVNLNAVLVRHIKKIIDSSYSNIDSVESWLKFYVVGEIIESYIFENKSMTDESFSSELSNLILELSYGVMIKRTCPFEMLSRLIDEYGSPFFKFGLHFTEHVERHYFNKFEYVSRIENILSIQNGIMESDDIVIKGNRLSAAIRKKEKILRAIDLVLHKDMRLNHILSIGWSGLSSGEEAKIKLLSRLTHGLRLFCNDDKYNKKTSVIVLIDEIDLYLNPEWQRSIVSSILHTVDKIVDSNVRVQFILTSHSPIIASDILQHDIIYMKKKDDKIYIDKSVKGFGSSISELYFESFNCDSTLGKLSRTKIDDLIEKSKDGLDNSDLDIVSLIGNDFLKNELLKRAKK
ncbi:AAA family ATPase [Vibrio mimicus]|uniref:AAA family ATPase n=1 Tax=Vibrio mimicus TaxID=674 RepID=UPI002FF0E761